MEQTLTVGLKERSYPIHIGSGILPKLGEYLRVQLRPLRYAVIGDETVAALHGDKVLASLAAAGLEGELFTFPPGEAGKRLAAIERLAGDMTERGFDRSHAVLACACAATVPAVCTVNVDSDWGVDVFACIRKKADEGTFFVHARALPAVGGVA